MMTVIEYPKIPGPFKREVSGPNKNKLIPWSWSSPELEYLSNTDWIFTEKIDGTNIRIIWDGHKPEFRGRTDRAQIPAKLMSALIDMFPEELFEQKFGSDEVILFGEGYGAGIQKGGGNYSQDNSFILFDVKIGPWWLQRDAVVDIAESLGLEVVPLIHGSSLKGAISVVAYKELKSTFGDFIAEGIVGQPSVPIFSRKGERIIVKLKGCDLYGLELS
jgi:RNA ligase-like protein